MCKYSKKPIDGCLVPTSSREKDGGVHGTCVNWADTRRHVENTNTRNHFVIPSSQVSCVRSLAFPEK